MRAPAKIHASNMLNLRAIRSLDEANIGYISFDGATQFLVVQNNLSADILQSAHIDIALRPYGGGLLFLNNDISVALEEGDNGLLRIKVLLYSAAKSRKWTFASEYLIRKKRWIKLRFATRPNRYTKKVRLFEGSKPKRFNTIGCAWREAEDDNGEIKLYPKKTQNKTCPAIPSLDKKFYIGGSPNSRGLEFDFGYMRVSDLTAYDGEKDAIPAHLYPYKNTFLYLTPYKIKDFDARDISAYGSHGQGWNAPRLVTDSTEEYFDYMVFEDLVKVRKSYLSCMKASIVDSDKNLKTKAISEVKETIVDKYGVQNLPFSRHSLASYIKNKYPCFSFLQPNSIEKHYIMNMGLSFSRGSKKNAVTAESCLEDA